MGFIEETPQSKVSIGRLIEHDKRDDEELEDPDFL